MEFEAQLLDIIPHKHCGECVEAKTFRFENSAGLEYKAGQFFFVEITENEEVYRHHFSFSSSPTEKGYFEFTTKMRDSDFKNALNKLRGGDTVKIRAPFGDFILGERMDKIGMLSGGIGITPLKSICKWCTDKDLPVDIVLLYGSHRESDILFRDEFDEMAETNDNLRVIYTLEKPSTAWEGYTGYIDKYMVQTEIPDLLKRILYICGPPPMVESMGELLKNLGLSETQIRREGFTGYEETYL